MMKVRFGSFLFDNTTDLCALSKICDPRHSLGNSGHHARQLVQGLVRLLDTHHNPSKPSAQQKDSPSVVFGISAKLATPQAVLDI